MSSIIINQIRQRIFHKNKNFCLVVCGGTGEGKSSLSIAIAQAIDASLTTKRILWEEEDIFKVVQDANWQHGWGLVFEELGTKLDNREWYSITNKSMTYLLQTWRYKKACFVANVPELSFIDKKAIKLFHAFAQPISINQRAKQVIAKFFWLQHNPRTGKTYFKYPRIKLNGVVKVVKEFRISLPSQELWDAYEKIMVHEKNKIATDALRGIHLEKAKIRSMEERYLGDEIYAEILKKIVVNPKKYIGRSGEISMAKIIKYENVKHTAAADIARKAQGQLEEKLE